MFFFLCWQLIDTAADSYRHRGSTWIQLHGTVRKRTARLQPQIDRFLAVAAEEKTLAVLIAVAPAPALVVAVAVVACL